MDKAFYDSVINQSINNGGENARVVVESIGFEFSYQKVGLDNQAIVMHLQKIREDIPYIFPFIFLSEVRMETVHYLQILCREKLSS